MVFSGLSTLPSCQDVLNSVAQFREKTENSQRETSTISIHALSAEKQKEYYKFIQEQTHNAIKRGWSCKERTHYKEEIIKAKEQHVPVENNKIDQYN